MSKGVQGRECNFLRIKENQNNLNNLNLQKFSNCMEGVCQERECLTSFWELLRRNLFLWGWRREEVRLSRTESEVIGG